MSDKPKRIQLKRTKGWRLPEGAKSVARPGKWGNPYKVGATLADIPHKIVRAAGYSTLPADFRITQQMAVNLHRAMIEDKVKRDSDFLNTLRRELGDCDLACWCGLGDPCHGNTLLELANGGEG